MTPWDPAPGGHLDESGRTVNFSPRLGITAGVGRQGLLSAYLGANYLRANSILRNSITFDTPGAPGGPTTTIDYEIRQKNKNQWNYMLGVNWDITKRWSILFELGVGGSRQNIITSGTYRF